MVGSAEIKRYNSVAMLSISYINYIQHHSNPVGVTYETQVRSKCERDATWKLIYKMIFPIKILYDFLYYSVRFTQYEKDAIYNWYVR